MLESDQEGMVVYGGSYANERRKVGLVNLPGVYVWKPWWTHNTSLCVSLTMGNGVMEDTKRVDREGHRAIPSETGNPVDTRGTDGFGQDQGRPKAI